MQNLGELLFQGKMLTGEFGIEVEVEGVKVAPMNNIHWMSKPDNSLRGIENLEYVLKKPITYNTIPKAVKALVTHWNKNNTDVMEVFRAGIHVHINVRDLTFKQLITFLSIAYIVEGLLVDFCGEERTGNYFCLISQDAEFPLYALDEACKTQNIKVLRNDDLRYSFINLKAIPEYGSVEFRGLKTTKQCEQIYPFATMLKAMKEFSKKSSPTKLVEDFSKQGVDEWLLAIFEEDLPKIYHGTKEENHTLHQNMRRIQNIVYGYDWDKVYGNAPVVIDLND
jgi:hypothetical protein